MNTSQFGVVSSIYTLGGLVGALCAGGFTTKYGRLMALRVCSAFFILGPVAESLSQSVGLLGFGRFLSGIGAGASVVVVPMYIAEIAPPKQRGYFGAFTQVMTNAGILVALLLGFFLSKDSLWRIVLGAAGLIGLIQLIGLLFVPESPKWLAEHKHQAQARRVLQRIRGSRANIESEVKIWNLNESFTEEESLLMPAPASHLHPKTPPISFTGAMTNPKYRPAIIAVIAVMVSQQFTGINSIVMYSVSILQSLLPTSAALLTVVVAAGNLIVTLACAPLADKIGRKTCLLTSISGMGINAFLLALGIMFSIKPLSAIATLLFVASFGVGLGPVPFILASELVGPEAVGATQSWALAANWIATFVVAQFFPILNVAMGGHGTVYFIFTAMAVFLGGFIWYWVPETLGKEGMAEVWGWDKSGNRRDD
jgi:sugar porter (SP) family MFS transporter